MSYRLLTPVLLLVLLILPVLACGDDADVNGNGAGDDKGNGETADSVTFPESPQVSPGYQFEIRSELNQEMETNVYIDGEVAQTEEFSTDEDIHMTIVVQEVSDNGRIEAMQIEVHTYESSGVQMGMERDRTSPTVGNTYVANRDGQDWSVTRDGEPVSGPERADLEPYLDQSVVDHKVTTLAGNTLNAGDTVEFDPEILFAELVQEDMEVGFRGEFEGIDTINDRQAARFSLELTLASEDEQESMNAELAGPMYVDVNTFVDVSSEAQGTMTFGESPTPEREVQGEGDMTVVTSTEIRPASD